MDMMRRKSSSGVLAGADWCKWKVLVTAISEPRVQFWKYCDTCRILWTVTQSLYRTHLGTFSQPVEIEMQQVC